MLRSMYSGVSGMRSFQTKMDVIANNIANVNTTGFKSGRVKFQDMLSQTTSNAQGATGNNLGGVNAQQIGLGVKVAGIDTIMTGGALQPTNRDLDFAIENDGFFILSAVNNGGDVDEEADLKNFSYTRDGAFYRDNLGNLVNVNGYRVMGMSFEPGEQMAEDFEGFDEEFEYTDLRPLKIPNTFDGDPDSEDTLESYAIDSSGLITAKYKEGGSVVLGKMALTKFSNPEGLQKQGSNNYSASNNSGDPTFGFSGEEGFGSIRQGYLEMSNVDLATEFTEMIVTSRAYQANSRSITTSDEMIQELLSLKR